MKIAGKFVSYEEKEYNIDGKNVTGRLLNIQVDGALLSFKGGSINRELSAGVFGQYEVGDPMTLECSIVIKDFKELQTREGKDPRIVKVPTLVVDNVV